MTGRWRALVLRWMWLVGPLLTLAGFGGPTLLLHVVVDDAVECFASIPKRAAAELPPCDAQVHRLEHLERLPFVGRPSVRAREEIVARMARWRYVDAAVGEPSREALTEAFADLRPAAQSIWDGSRRLRMDEVGPPVPVPEPGALAFSVGDRRTLDLRAFEWSQHYTETRAMEAALLEGRLDRAVRLAEHYQGRPNTDLRVRVGALLCAGGQHDTGIEQVLEVETGRASHRTANFARNFGGVRVVHEACTHLAKLVPAPVPQYGDAGQFDHRERLAAMRMRHLRARHPACDLSDPLGCRDDGDTARVLDDARDILRADRPRRHRVALFATIAESITHPDVAAKLGMPRPGEPALVDRIPFHPDQWLDQVADAPFVTAERYEAAGTHLAELDAPALTRLVQVLWLRAAVGYAQRRDLGAADRCLQRSKLTGPELLVMRANAALVAGEPAEARGRLAGEAPRHPLLLLLRAALTLPDVDVARAQLKEALAQAEDSRVVERIRWLLVSLGVPTRGKRVVDPQDLDVPPRYRFTGWRDGSVTEAVRSANLDDALAVWHTWLSSDARRQMRYLAFAHRGDAPEGLTPLLHAGYGLSAPELTNEQIEIWLDALMAFDARRFSLRQVAFARWRAAQWRGDAEAAAVWLVRYQKLAELSQDPKLADLLRAVRI